MNTRRATTSTRNRKATTRARKCFTSVFDGLSPLVQRQIVEKSLIPLLDSVPPKDAKRALGKARRITKRYEKVPQVDMGAKKTEINGLLDELAKDAKLALRSSSKSKYEVLFNEVVDSVAEWLNDLWSLAFESGHDFPRAHSCLLFSIGVLDQVRDMRSSGCHCSLPTIYVPVKIRDRSGEVVKEFSELGLSNVEAAILWVWRDVFLALLASNNQTLVKLVPRLLAEIDDIVGWTGLEHLVLGGFTYKQAKDSFGIERTDNASSHKDNFWDPSSDSDDAHDPVTATSHDESTTSAPTEKYFAEHWTYKLIRQVPRFHLLVQSRMLEIFRMQPSLHLYISLHGFARETDKRVIDELRVILERLATTSASSLATALEIYELECNAEKIASLLESHAFLLRPRDRVALQGAVQTLGESPVPSHHALALRMAKKELLETAQYIQHALKDVFSRIDAPSQRAELTRIVKMRKGSDERREKVESWVEASVTPGLGAANPMAFAAMMMGLPIPIPVPIPFPNPGGGPGADDADGGGAGPAVGAAAALNAALVDADDVDQYFTFGLMEGDPHDPDFADLREEQKPDLRGRFMDWVETTARIESLINGERERERQQGEREWEREGSGKGKGKGNAERKIGRVEVLESVYKRLVVSMPWIAGTDIVEEMVARIADKPSKQHICDALEALGSFAKAHRRQARRRRLRAVVQKALTQLNRTMLGQDLEEALGSGSGGAHLPPLWEGAEMEAEAEKGGEGEPPAFFVFDSAEGPSTAGPSNTSASPPASAPVPSGPRENEDTDPEIDEQETDVEDETESLSLAINHIHLHLNQHQHQHQHGYHHHHHYHYTHHVNEDEDEDDLPPLEPVGTIHAEREGEAEIQPEIEDEANVVAPIVPFFHSNFVSEPTSAHGAETALPVPLSFDGINDLD